MESKGALQQELHIFGQKPIRKAKNRKCKILIVDDEADLCEVLAQIFREKGYLADTAVTVADAIGKMEHNYYNLMITDIKLPDRSGIDLMEMVEEVSPATAIIVITAFPEAETAIRALNNGAVNYLTKPFSHKELLSSVDKALLKQSLVSANMQLVERLRRKKEKLEKLSLTDKLTGLYNRAYFEEVLAREEMRFKRYNRPIAILMVDINDLKQINDHFGHPKGDMVIKETARLLQNICRASDIVARYGGDEFIILLPETTEEGASSLRNSLRKAVIQWNLCHIECGLTLNLAIGYACMHNGANLIDLLNRVDANMYQDKLEQKAFRLLQMKENRD